MSTKVNSPDELPQKPGIYIMKDKNEEIFMDKCKWTIREGTNNTFWAWTPCKAGFNYLSKINKTEDIKPIYDNRECPICKRPIVCNTELLNDIINIEG